jgi:hypothetical protein
MTIRRILVRKYHQAALSFHADGQNGNNHSQVAAAKKTTLPNQVLRYTDGMRFPQAGRLVVLLPAQDLDGVKISRAIWSLASPRRLEVLLLTIVKDLESELSSKRDLATIGALIREPNVKVNSLVVHEKSWVKAVSRVIRPGDVIVCPAELTAAERGGKRIAMDTALINALNAPVFVVKGFYHEPPHPSFWRFLRPLPYWIVLIAIFAGFTELEMKSDLLTKGWSGQVIFSLIVIVEIIAIYYWTLVAG